MGRWGGYKDQAPKNDGKYVKLNDGDKIRFALTDEDPGQRAQYWLDNKVVPAGTKGADLDTKIVLCVYDIDLRKMRILSITPRTFVRLCEKAEKFGEEATPNSYELERKKTNGKVEYELDRLDRLAPDMIALIKRADTFDVLSEDGVIPLPDSKLQQPPAPATGPNAASPTAAPAAGAQVPEDEIPF